MLLLPVFAITYYLSFWLRYEGQISDRAFYGFRNTVGLVVLAKAILFGRFNVYQSWRRYVTFYDLISLAKASTASVITTVLIIRFLLPDATVPRTVFVLDWGSTIVVLGGVRALFRMIHEHKWTLLPSSKTTPAFIVGANDTGESLLRAILRNKTLRTRVVGFLDNNPSLIGTRLSGVPVVGTLDKTCSLAKKHRVRQVLIATGELPGRQVRKLVDDTQDTNVSVKVVPSYEQLIKGRVSIHPRPVKIDDLLGREPVQLDMGNIHNWIDNRVVMVTGGAGSIGSEICKQLLKFSPKQIIILDRSETGQFFLEQELLALANHIDIKVCIADLLDEGRMKRVFEQHKPNIVFHAAAYKHVPLMEAHPDEAVKNIIHATHIVADLSMAHNAETFVMISTDKAVNPTSLMGACKRAAELYVQSMANLSQCSFVTVRFGNVLDSVGSVVPVFRQQIIQGGPVTVTDERMKRFFMTIPEASRLVIQAGSIGNDGEILLLDMGAPVRIVDLANDMIRLSGLTVGDDIDIVFTGTRPGEKLFEELHVTGETSLPTRHEKIMIVDRKRRDPSSTQNAISTIVALSYDNPELIRLHLQSLIPEYKTPEDSVGRAA